MCKSMLYVHCMSITLHDKLNSVKRSSNIRVETFFWHTAAAWLLQSRVRIPLKAWMFVSCVYMLRCRM
jgi:hypothetical protein